MAYIVACYKSVIDENDVAVAANGSVSLKGASRKISDYEKSILGAGGQLAAASGDTLACLTFGTDACLPQVKDALSRGPAEAFSVIDEAAENADAKLTADALCGAVEKIGDVHAVVCGDGSSDVYQKQTGPRMAALLDWPFVGNAVSAEVVGDGFKVAQKIDGAIRIVTVKAPCVISALPEICQPKTPGMRDILAAKKKPATQWTLADLNVAACTAVEVDELRGFVMERKNVMLEGSASEAATELVDALKKEGIL